MSQSDASWLSNADNDVNSSGAELVSPDEIQQTELNLGVDLTGDGLVGPQ
jgi:hypothetical protein